MKKLILSLLIAASALSVKSQTSNPFPTTDSLIKYINKWVRNSPTDAFMQLRMNTAMIGITRFLETSYGGQVVSFTKIGDTLRIVTAGGDNLDVVLEDGGGGTNLTFTRNGTTLTVVSSSGTDVILPSATQSNAGILTAADKIRIDSSLQMQQFRDSLAVFLRIDDTATMLDGYLNSTDTVSLSDRINLRQPAGNYISGLTGSVLATGPVGGGVANAVIANSGVAAGEYTNPNIIVGVDGRITFAENGTSGGSGTDNTNLGSFYKVLNNTSQGIKTFEPTTTLLWDSTTTTLRARVDTSSGKIATQYMVSLKADPLGFTPENVANKSTSTSLGGSNTLYPSQNAVKTYVDNIAVTKQDLLGYTPENVANKSTNTSLGTSNTLYPTQNAVKVYVDNQIAGVTFPTVDATLTDGSTNAIQNNAVYDGLQLKLNKSDTAAMLLPYANKINTKQGIIALTTTGSSGAATFDGSTLNIPQYSGGGGSGTVNTGAANTLAYYSASGTVIDDLAAITASRALVSNASGLPVASSVTTTELGYVSGATSSLQTQINTKQATITTGSTAQYFRGDLSLATFPTTVSTFTNDAGYITASSTNTLTNKSISGATNTLSNINLTSLIQDGAATGSVIKWNGSAWAPGTDNTSGGGGGSGTVNSGLANRLSYYAADGTTVDALAAITANRAIVSNSNGLPVAAATTSTEIGYVSGVTSAIQTQLNTKLENITGKVTAGSNISISGSGTTASPYVINNSSPGATYGAGYGIDTDGENNFLLDTAVSSGLYLQRGNLVAGTNITITPSGNQYVIASSGGGLTDGDKGEVIVASSGASLLLDNGIAATKLADGSVTSTEFQYINSLTSNAQTQIDGKIGTISAIGSSPNANGGSISSGALTLQPADYTYGGVLTQPNFVKHDNKAPYWPEGLKRQQSGLPAVLNAAVDVTGATDYNSWPSIIKDRRGRLHIYYISSATGHLGTDHLLKQAISGDGGSTWSTRTLTIPQGQCYEVHALLLSNGKIGLGINCDDAGANNTDYFMDSEDDGETFNTPVTVFPKGTSTFGPQSTSLLEDRGVLYITTQAKYSGSANTTTLLKRSFDWGKTWGSIITIASATGTDFNESKIVRWKDQLVAFVRDETNLRLLRTFSTDGGSTWSSRTVVTPPDFEVSEPDAIVVGDVVHLHYRSYTGGTGELHRAISYDGGFTWPDDEVVDVTTGGGAMQYASTIYEDGMLITAYGLDQGSGLVDAKIRLITYAWGYAVGLNGVPSSGGGSDLWTLTGTEIYRNSDVSIGHTAAPVVTLDVRNTSGPASMYLLNNGGATDYSIMLFGQGDAVGQYGATWRLGNSFSAYGLSAGSLLFENHDHDIVFSTEYDATGVAFFRKDLKIDGTTGGLSAASLAGSGTRMLVADATGNISTQTIGGGGGITLTDNQIAFGAATSNTVEGSANFTYDGSIFNVKTANNTGFIFKEYNSNYYSLYANNLTPGDPNYLILSKKDGTETYLNGTTSIELDVNGVSALSATSSGVVINSGSNTLALPTTRPGTNGYVPTFNTDGTFAAWAANSGGGGGGESLAATLTIGNTVNSGQFINFAASSGSARNVAIINQNSGADNFAMLDFLPTSGTNAATLVRILPNGTGFSSSFKSGLELYNAEGANFEVFSMYATGATGYTLASSAGGSGTVRPFTFQTAGVDRLSLGASGGVTINASTSSYTLPTSRPAGNGYSLTANTDGTTAWTNVTGGGGGGASWGSITGTLSSQTDLNTALGLKAPLASPTFTGTVTYGRVATTGSTPTYTDGPNLTATVTVTGNDVAGVITVNVTSSTSIPTLEEYATITFNTPYATQPIISITPANASAGALDWYLKSPTVNNFSIARISSGTSQAGATYVWHYHVIQ